MPASMCKPRVPSPSLHKSSLLIRASNPIIQEDEKGGSEVQSIGWGDGSVEKWLAVHAWGSKFTSPESKYRWEPEHTSLIKVLIRQEARCRQENPWMFTNRSACIHSIEYQQKESASNKVEGKQGTKIVLWPLPTCCDIQGTTLRQITCTQPHTRNSKSRLAKKRVWDG